MPKRDHETEPTRIALVAYDGYTDVDLIFMWDLLNRVRHPLWSVRILGEAPFHTSMSGLTVPVHGGLDETRGAHAVLFTSGKGNRVKIKDPAYLGQFHLDPRRQLIGSICSGALLLAALGLLKGKRATTYPTARRELESYGVTVVEDRFVQEGNVATAAGCVAAVDLSAWVIAQLASEEVAAEVVASCQPVGQGLYFEESPDHRAAGAA
jgi:transcriptional regulator GlxA family with amidase domain